MENNGWPQIQGVFWHFIKFLPSQAHLLSFICSGVAGASSSTTQQHHSGGGGAAAADSVSFRRVQSCNPSLSLGSGCHLERIDCESLVDVDGAGSAASTRGLPGSILAYRVSPYYTFFLRRDPKNTTLKNYRLCGQAHPRLRIKIRKAATTGCFDV